MTQDSKEYAKIIINIDVRNVYAEDIHEDIFNKALEKIKADALEKVNEAFKKCIIPKPKFKIGQKIRFADDFSFSVFEGIVEDVKHVKRQDYITVWEEIGGWYYKTSRFDWWVDEKRCA